MPGADLKSSERAPTGGAGTEAAPNATQILIIGAGAAGLSTAGALKKIGLAATVLERDTSIGGTWARRYDRLRLHTIRQLSGLAHLPLPRRYPRYVARDQFVRYLQHYATKLDLNIITGCKVQRVMPPDGTDGAMGYSWRVETDRGIWYSQVVVLATGQYSVPRLPSWPGREAFAGQFIHSSEYRNGRAWAGKRALVIGVGNSGAEIATDLADAGASYVAVSIRTPPFLTRRQTYGLPVQLLSFPMGWLPPRVADKVARSIMRLAFGDMSKHGLMAPGYSPYQDQRVPLIDVGFAAAVKQGRVAVRPDIVSFTPTGAIFNNGHAEAFDLVVAATGFSSGLERLVPIAGLLAEDAYPDSPSGEPTSQPGLYFIGFTHSLHGHLYEANRASRRLAKYIATYLGKAAA
ncbi:MAG TPA: NAD(P)/FAD-dependent oxidoreductase [Chloroflexia bacterium]|nr:NAD(P)/FAD-dependent oxidoreductase [Chloroflexia bacterium]